MTSAAERGCRDRHARETTGRWIAMMLVAGTMGLAAASASAQARAIETVGGGPARGPAGIAPCADGSLAGRTGCDPFTGAGCMEAGALPVEGPLATTRMAGPEDLSAREPTVPDALRGRVLVACDPFTRRATWSARRPRPVWRPLRRRPAGARRPTAAGPRPPPRRTAPAGTAGCGPCQRLRPVRPSRDPRRARHRGARGRPGPGRGAPGQSELPAGHGPRLVPVCEVDLLDTAAPSGRAAAEYADAAPAVLRAGQGPGRRSPGPRAPKGSTAWTVTQSAGSTNRFPAGG